MKVFKYRFTKLIKTFIIIGIVLCGVAFALNLYFCLTADIASDANPAYSIIQYSLMFLVVAVLTPLLISILTSSYYAIKDKTLITSFGFIKSKYDLEKVEVITLDRATNKLAVTFSDETFIVIVVKEEWYNDFVQGVLDANPKIEYRINSEKGEKKDN